MSYELQNFFKHQNSQNAYGWIGNPPLSPLPYHDGRNISKVKLKVDAYHPPTHAEN